MKIKQILALFLLLPCLAWALTEEETGAELKKLAWQNGPVSADIAGKAKINIPKNYVYLDDKNTRRFLELAGNPPSEGNYLIAPQSLRWFAIFSFDQSGYIKDDEKIDPADLLDKLRQSDGPANEERQRLGMPALHTDGWQVLPHYDSSTKRLEWGLRLKTDNNQQTINYTSRLLSRSGVMSAILVSDVAQLDKDTVEFKTALKDFSFNAGESYSEFRDGDKIAEYGLGALILGGAAAVAAKKGFFALIGGFLVAFWKALIGLAIAALAGLKSLFSRKKE
jgi:uncharacterized membrane-anchored protein